MNRMILRMVNWLWLSNKCKLISNPFRVFCSVFIVLLFDLSGVAVGCLLVLGEEYWRMVLISALSVPDRLRSLLRVNLEFDVCFWVALTAQGGVFSYVPPRVSVLRAGDGLEANGGIPVLGVPLGLGLGGISLLRGW
ncbi:hypothetical protein Tco_0620925 [Tanacetum coccineum]